MKIFCAYAFTGEDLGVVTDRMKMVVETLGSAGHVAYCNLFDPVVDAIKEKDDVAAIFDRAFEVIDSNNALVAIITSPNKSVGQIMEIGVALSKQMPIYIFEHTSAVGSTYLPQLAKQHFSYDTNEELKQLLLSIK